MSLGTWLASQLLIESPVLTGKIKKVIAIYPGRFQPMGKHHADVYKFVRRIFGANNTFLATSNVVSLPKSPFSFKEKSIIAKAHGIKNVVNVKNPYRAEEIVAKFDPETTAVVFIVGEKDQERLGGKFFLPWKGTAEYGYKVHAYTMNAPTMRGGMSGTEIRKILGDNNISWKKRHQFYNQVIGISDEKIEDMIVNKLGAINSMMESFLQTINIHDVLKTSKKINATSNSIAKSLGKDLIEYIVGNNSLQIKTEGVIALGNKFIEYMTPSNILSEGGAAGHMAHVIDDMNLTFGDLSKIIGLGLQGKLSKHVSEKLDGQAISFSWKDGKLIAARNKGHYKNGGAGAMDVNGVLQQFSGRGALTDAFVFAVQDLQNAVKSLSQKDKDSIFKNGYKFMHTEIIWPDTQNVIPYDTSLLIFHGSTEYDDAGNVVDANPKDASTLAKLIQKVNQHIQNKFTIQGPSFVKLSPVTDFSSKQAMFQNKLKQLQSKFNLKSSDKVSKYHQAWWADFISKQAQKNNYPIPNHVLGSLVNRWAFFDKSYSIANMKKEIDNTEFLEWATTFDKKDHAGQVKINMQPFDILFLHVGAEILKNVSDVLSVNPSSAAHRIRQSVEADIKTLESSNDITKIEKLKTQLTRLNAIGGFDAIVPTEGIVFMYKGKIYKFTGAFASVNALLGILKFGN